MDVPIPEDEDWVESKRMREEAFREVFGDPENLEEVEQGIREALRQQVREDKEAKRRRKEEEDQDADVLSIDRDSVGQVLRRIEAWICEIQDAGLEEDQEVQQGAWDDVHGGTYL